MEDAYAASASEVLKHFGGVSEKHGLSDAEVEVARATYGKNCEASPLRSGEFLDGS